MTQEDPKKANKFSVQLNDVLFFCILIVMVIQIFYNLENYVRAFPKFFQICFSIFSLVRHLLAG